ncbi:glycerophosphodiester phosphodiesterase family protein [Marispirochaeta sp.]|uniref:glycerophosphodiester phosphodiesterase n=1 Tax=Marispirochaeta sp. TaxID=2038653 RepID=UPI0029C67D69|nr:glycerophosphodiester phosphodiesterase family protein [Marispirochaeta sp.]
MIPLFPETARPLVFAHRGCSYRAPENTMAAFELAVKQQIPGIELDIQLSADGELVVFHDSNLERICGISGSVTDFTMKELQQMDAGTWKAPQYTGSGIPSLREVLSAFGGSVLFDVEIKYYRFREALNIPAAMAELLDELDLHEGIAVSSFDPRIVRRAKQVLPSIPAGLIHDAGSLPSWLPLAAACSYSRADFRKPSSAIIKGPVSGRHPRLCWTVDSSDEARRCLSAGAAGIISNRPEDLLILNVH